jgi:SnoaL-like domain
MTIDRSGSGESATRDVIARYVKAVHDQDYDTVTSLQHPDFIEDWPQSRERIRGRANLRRIMENYPGGLEGADADVTMDRVIGGEDHWMVAPTFSMIRVSGADDVHTAIVKLRYPDGGEWFMVALIELKDGLIYRVTSFFAPTLESPEWRRDWVERLPESPAGG